MWQSARLGRVRAHMPVVLLLLALVPAILPFLTPGYFWNANDARHDAYFIFEYDRGLRFGDWYPRWSPDFTFGYGYPFFNIYAPLAVQVGEAFHLLGLGFTQAVEMVFVLSILLSALAMYGFLRGLVGRVAAAVSAVAYVYAPYHLFDMYQRAAMAESFAFVWLPLVLWGVRSSVTRPRWASVVGLGVAYAGLMLTSNLVAVLFTPVVVGYVLVVAWPGGALPRARDVWVLVRRVIPTAVGGLLGLGLSAWFWLPALLEFKYVNQEQWYGGYYDYRLHFVYFFQLFSPHWGFGISVPGPDDVISYQVGLVPYLLALAGAWSVCRTTRALWRRTALYLALVAVVAAFLTTGASAWVWERVPGVSFAQFPWRYLMLTVLGMAVLVAGAASGGGRVPPWLRGGMLALLLLLGSAAYLKVEVVDPLPEQGPVGLPALMRFQASENEMTGVTIFAREVPRWSGLAEIMVRGEDVPTRVEFGHVQADPFLEVQLLEYGGSWERIRFEAQRPGRKIVFNLQMYPGWTAYIYDETGTTLQQVLSWQELTVTDPYGLVTVPVPDGRHVLLLRFEDTLPRRVGKGISLGALLGVVLGGLIFRSRHAMRDA